ncbi:hypothetical protein BCR34DRAFT_196052 [Clohesyomyces aquaticus]|uniref:Uncharacterized protein n=1 Tax=Clohesyomyces aquaticus TaxID=1231657 RepID=A0A1Y1YBL4_9PLEO|nr:hypothetical protein BCR34DRAFT_196052 [Clohesyomyces aquaticus]
MFPSASSRRAAVDAAYPRRRTPPPSRTGLDESGRRRPRKWKERDRDGLSGAEASSYTSGSATAWDSDEEGAPVMELMGDIFSALERMGRRDKGKRREDRAAISIHNLATQLSEFLPPSPVPSPNLWLSDPPENGAPPPSYDDTLADLPPDYTTTDALASAQTPEYTPFSSLNPSLCSNVPNCLRLSCATSPTSSFYLDEKSLYADIDFGFCEDGVKSHAKKKKGAAAKKPVEEKKEEEPAGGSGDAGAGDSGGSGDPPPDGGAGGSGGGDDGNGGDGNGGGGGDGDGWGDNAGWGATTKKKKKKGKKAEEEEEAERKKKEEEEEDAERKRKEEEEEAERKRLEDEPSSR